MSLIFPDPLQHIEVQLARREIFVLRRLGRGVRDGRISVAEQARRTGHRWALRSQTEEQAALPRAHRTFEIELNEVALRRCESSTQEVKGMLRDLGYRGWLIGRKAVRPLPDGQLTHECDECLFVHRDNESMIRRLRLP